MNTLLHVSDLQAWYGTSQALFGVDLSIPEGKVVALMGRNGMGKTTTIATICKLMRRWQGKLEFADHDLASLPSHKAARLGIGLVPEGRRCFANLTVEENCRAVERAGDWDFAKACELFPRLGERRDQMAGTLSGGEQQMLAIARALIINPRLLILDEATEGLAPTVRAEIWAAIRELKAAGFAILLVDKSLNEVLEIADACVVLEKGAVAWAGAPGELDASLQDRYLGV